MRDELVDFKIVRNPLTALMNYIKQNIKNIMPVGIGEGYYFQVRIDAKQFEALPDKVKNILREACNVKHPYHKPEMTDDIKRWTEENYWTPCDAYIFNYMADGYCLSYNEIYGYEGVEENDTMYFLNVNNLPKLVWKNRNAYERRDEEEHQFRWK